jgi:IclR family acetate operon transcriptional repressor
MAALKTQTAPAVDRALSILEILAQSGTGLTLPELVDHSNLPRSSVHYLLVTLERRGYLERNHRTGRYLFSTKLLGLARGAAEGLSIAEQATPHLWRLTQATGLSAHIGILQDDEVVLVAKVDPPRAAGRSTWPGKRMAMHSTALGKVLLASLPDVHVALIVRERGLPRHNENTISSARALNHELARIRLSGYAVDAEEDELGSACLGVPILNGRGETVAGLSLAGTIAELTEERFQHLLPLLSEAAASIARAAWPQGFSGPRQLRRGELVEQRFARMEPSNVLAKDFPDARNKVRAQA